MVSYHTILVWFVPVSTDIQTPCKQYVRLEAAEDLLCLLRVLVLLLHQGRSRIMKLSRSFYLYGHTQMATHWAHTVKASKTCRELDPPLASSVQKRRCHKMICNAWPKIPQPPPSWQLTNCPPTTPIVFTSPVNYKSIPLCTFWLRSIAARLAFRRSSFSICYGMLILIPRRGPLRMVSSVKVLHSA